MFSMLFTMKAQVVPDGYVDLGLPSGVLWKLQDETNPYWVYDDALNNFREELPSYEQWIELKNYCKWTWKTNNNVKGYEIEGQNGNTIFLPQNMFYRNCDGNITDYGFETDYWSSTIDVRTYAWCIEFDNDYIGMRSKDNCLGLHVRLIKKPQGGKYVDLGLPSGTLWKETNEADLYTQTQAQEQFGNKLPTKKQIEELIHFCKWKWQNNGYVIIGPNNGFIFIPAMGLKRGTYEAIWGAGVIGCYLSSTSNGSYGMYGLSFDGSDVKLVDNFLPDQGQGLVKYAIRLVR